ncbi:hypothetical protein [Neisseria sp. Ec49-e6-T10]|uniref:hypothetical protein n=1 Tax=Neisseria sp. Ec49-e6-T10 TaxID=3140744 RepID=UPI003EBAFA32
MNKQPITVSFLSTSLADETLLKQTILAAAQQLELMIVFNNSTEPNILFVHAHSAFTQIMLNKTKDSAQPILFFVHNQEEPFFHDHPCIKATITVQALIPLFQQYLIPNISTIQTTEQPKLDIQPQKAKPFSSLTQLAQYLFAYAPEEEISCSIEHNNRIITLDAKSETFFLNSTETYDFNKNNTSIEKLLQCFKHGGEITLFPRKHLDQQTHQYPKYLLERFLWILGTQITTQLIHNISDKNTFGVTRWPDFGSLKTDPIYLRVCTLMTQQPLTIEEMKKRFHFTQEQCIGFLNSCMLCQCLIWGERENNPTFTKDHHVAPTLSLSEIQNCRIDLGIDHDHG